jgi:hypothetical protein
MSSYARFDPRGRKPVTDRTRRSEVAEDQIMRVPAEDLELVFDLLDDADAPVAQQALTQAVEELLECPHGTAAAKVSRALLWLHREGMIRWVGSIHMGESTKPSNTWTVAYGDSE